MPDVTASADSPQDSTSLPMADNVRAALVRLWRAYDLARDAHAALWDFAVEISRLYEAGLATSDLRWLLAKGFVQHGDETSVYRDAHRSFAPSDGFNFLENTSFVLTEKGAAFVSQVLHATAGPSDATQPFAHALQATQPSTPLRPHWDPVRHELSLGQVTVKRFLVPARNQQLILSAFQEEGWPQYIDDPLPGNDKGNRKARLHDAINRLNGKQLAPSLRFHGNGNGNGVTWRLTSS